MVVSFYGGPGIGKSGLAGELYGALKKAHVNCELAREYAKIKVWEGSTEVLRDQVYMFGKQNHKLKMLDGKVDVIITDAPILMNIIYDIEESRELEALIMKEYGKYHNLDVMVIRDQSIEYSQDGRVHSFEESIKIDDKIKKMLLSKNINYMTIRAGDDKAISNICSIIKDAIDKKKHDEKIQS